MSTLIPLGMAAPVVGFAVAWLLPRRPTRRTRPRQTERRVMPVVVQRGEVHSQLLLDDTDPAPDGAQPTPSRSVYATDFAWDTSECPALVTVGRLDDAEILVDIARAGVVALTGDRDAAMSMLRSVWAELRWPAEAHELEVVGVEGLDLPGLSTIPWSHALTRLERGSERSRPLVVLASATPTGDDAVRLAAIPSGANVGVILLGDWSTPWQLHNRSGKARLEPLGLDISPTTAAPDVELREPEAETPEPLVAPNAQDEVSVSVLGRVQVTGRLLSEKETELVAFLALHSRGVTEVELRTALWPERDVPRGTFNNLVSATRRHLGAAADGERLLPHCDKGLYRLHPSVGCDLLDLGHAVGRRHELEADTQSQIDALTAMRGRPFEGCVAEWPFDDGLVARAEALVTRAARGVANAAGTAGVDAAIDAVVSALAAVPDPAIEDALRELRHVPASA